MISDKSCRQTGEGQVTVGFTQADNRSKLEPFESFKFTPNCLSSFYPKNMQKLLARKQKLTSVQQTSERLTASLKMPANPQKAQKHL